MSVYWDAVVWVLGRLLAPLSQMGLYVASTLGGLGLQGLIEFGVNQGVVLWVWLLLLLG